MKNPIETTIKNICIQLGHNPDTPPVNLAPKELSAVTKVGVETLAHWRVTGKHGIPFIKFGGKVLYPLQEVAEYMVERTAINTGKGE